MAILQISQIQIRRGLNQDLPQLASGEMAWSTDTRQLYIGNGVVGAPDYAPKTGVTEILTEFSIINFTSGFAGNVTALQSNVATLQSEVAELQATVSSTSINLPSSSSGTITTLSANNAVITYTLTQANVSGQRTGTIRASYYAGTSTVSYDEEYDETATTDLSFNLTANATLASLNYTTTTATALKYRITTL
jgi:hypothetical protein